MNIKIKMVTQAMNQIRYIEYITNANDTFDFISLKMYHEETLSYYIWLANPEYTDVLFFDAGVKLRIPIIDKPKLPETLPPWRRV